MPLTASLSLNVQATLTGNADVGKVRQIIDETYLHSLTDGTGANQAQNVYADNFTITGAGTQIYDLAGSLANALGATITFTAIKAVILRNTGSATITYGGGSNPFRGFLADATDKITIPAGGMMVLMDPTAAGQTVTAATGDLVLLAGTDVAGTIIFIGE